MKRIAQIWKRITQRLTHRDCRIELYGDSFPVMGGKFSW